MILGVAILIQCQGVTDGQTDRQTPRRQLRHAKHYMLSCTIKLMKTLTHVDQDSVTPYQCLYHFL